MVWFWSECWSDFDTKVWSSFQSKSNKHSDQNQTNIPTKIKPTLRKTIWLVWCWSDFDTKIVLIKIKPKLRKKQFGWIFGLIWIQKSDQCSNQNQTKTLKNQFGWFSFGWNFGRILVSKSNQQIVRFWNQNVTTFDHLKVRWSNQITKIEPIKSMIPTSN